MRAYPNIDDTSKSRSVATVFGGYNHRLSCAEGEFFDMTNITAQHYPILSPRQKRGIVRQLTNPKGLIAKEYLAWIDGTTLYINNQPKTLRASLSNTPKTLTKMGAYLIIMPDKVWYNVDDNTSGSMEASFSSSAQVKITLADAYGKAITWHDESYYTSHAPASGDYCMVTSDGTSVLKQWSSASSVWTQITTTYLQISCTGIGQNFNNGDGVYIQVDNSTAKWSEVSKVFVNDDGNNKYSSNFVITDKTADCITITGIVSANVTLASLPIVVKRKVPDMAYITECNNRLWGCSTDGHEVYCCKLGDCLNWNVFAGISTDAWAATVGSDGKFTGATTYLGYPTFFKEDLMLKISISSTGAHQIKESHCRGVQNGSDKSICILNEVLYYKSDSCVCAYSGSVPVSISDGFGETQYSNAVAGTIDDRYFISMQDAAGNWSMFVYDAKKNVWVRHDNTHAMAFAKCGDDLYYIDTDDKLIKSIKGALPFNVSEAKQENDFAWVADSGSIGYDTPDQKYCSRVSIRLQLEFGSRVEFYIQYDSSGVWEHIFNINGTGLRTFTVPVIPRRCDHFRYRLKGYGPAKVYSIAKTIEEGSDICKI